MSRPQAPLFSTDHLLQAADNALRALFAPAHSQRTPFGVPADPLQAVDPPMSESDRRHVAGLMRVNHAGEIAAQALYHGQALLARNPAVREFMLSAAAEEADHLAWCEQRLRELGDRTSLLNPLWYAGSFAIGAGAAALSDGLSLGFVTETERQVEGHLAEHLKALSAGDHRTRAILESMQRDEIGHAQAAHAAGAVSLPPWVQWTMRWVSKCMTRTAYWV